MAIIGKIRERSTLVLVIIGGAIVAFVLSDLFSSSSSGQQGPMSLAEVNDESISPQEFDFRVQKAYDNYQQRTNQELDERTKSSIREQVWNEIMSDILLGTQMDELGINVTSKELFDLVKGNNPHPQVKQAFTNPETGEFNSSAVVQFLQNLDNGDPKTKQQWVEFEKAVKRDHQMSKYYNLIKKGVYMPSELAKKQFQDNNSKLSFKYVYKPYSSIEDANVTLSEAEIEAYYEKHKSDYEQEASRKIAYAYFPVAPSERDEAMAEEWSKEIYAKFQKVENDSTFVNANSDERFDPFYYSKENAPIGADTSLWSKEVGYVAAPVKLSDMYFINKVRNRKTAPDSVKASHILINVQDRTEERAEAIADSLMALLEGGAAMSDLATENSDDVASAQEGGDLGWFTEGTMVPAFNNAAFAASPGEIKKVKTQFGFHLIEVTERTALKEKIQIASIKREILPGKETYEEIFNAANSFSIEASGVESFNQKIQEGNIQRRAAILQENDNSIQGLEASRDLARWVKEAKEGDVSEAYDVDEAFVVAVVEAVNEKGIAPLEKVRNRVEYLARQEKKGEMIKQEFAGASDLGSLASSNGLSVEKAENVSFSSPAIPQVGLEPKVVGKLMSLEAGQTSVPIAGNSGVFVVTLDNKVAAGEANVAMERGTRLRGIAARVDNGALFNALKEKAALTDNRSKFY
jgi:peptidyl-prolyl cis-trans isomerase D